MTASSSPICTAFDGHRQIASGSLSEVSLAVKYAMESGAAGPLMIFDDTSGRTIDVDFGATFQVMEALNGESIVAFPDLVMTPSTEIAQEEPSAARKPGRPKLGVVAREITLLPRHWEWLASQPGGASVAIRKLVEDARRVTGDRDRRLAAQTASFHFMSAIGGDLPGFEEATRALFADDPRGFAERIAAWPDDVRNHAVKLAFADLAPAA